MEVGLGMMGLTPDQFWAMTMPEFGAKLNGFREFHGGNKDAADDSSFPTRAEIDAMLEQFPDGPLPREIARRHKANRTLH